jgi:hypothetical protein
MTQRIAALSPETTTAPRGTIRVAFGKPEQFPYDGKQIVIATTKVNGTITSLIHDRGRKAHEDRFLLQTAGGGSAQPLKSISRVSSAVECFKSIILRDTTTDLLLLISPTLGMAGQECVPAIVTDENGQHSTFTWRNLTLRASIGLPDANSEQALVIEQVR